MPCVDVYDIVISWHGYRHLYIFINFIQQSMSPVLETLMQTGRGFTATMFGQKYALRGIWYIQCHYLSPVEDEYKLTPSHVHGRRKWQAWLWSAPFIIWGGHKITHITQERLQWWDPFEVHQFQNDSHEGRVGVCWCSPFPMMVLALFLWSVGRYQKFALCLCWAR